MPLTQESSSASPGRPLLAAAVVVAATLLGFATVLANGFVHWDDDATIYENPAFNPPRWDRIGRYWDWTKPAGQLYVPSTYTVWGVAAGIARGVAGPNPVVFHALSLLAHAVSAVLAYLVLLRLAGRCWPACAGAMFFALHPIQVEAVAWASGLKDVLAGMFGLAAFYQYMLFGGAWSPTVRASDHGRGIGHYVSGTAFLILALLCKPSAVVVPVLCAVFDVVSGRPWRSIARAAGPWLALTVPVILIGKYAQPATELPFVAYDLRPLVALDAITFYLTKLVWPVGLAVDHGRRPAAVLADGWLWLRCIPPIMLVAVAWLSRRRFAAMSLAACLFVVPLVPVLGFVPFDMQRHSTVADHYLYVGMLGPALLVAWGMTRIRTSTVLATGVVVMLAGLAMLSSIQIHHWRDSFHLWEHALAVNPTSPVANRTLGYLWAARGDTEKAATFYQTAARVGDDWLNQYNWGNLLFRQGRYDEAVRHYLIALGYNNREIDPHLAMGAALARGGRFAEAAASYQQAIGLDPDNAAARRGLEAARRDAARSTTMP